MVLGVDTGVLASVEHPPATRAVAGCDGMSDSTKGAVGTVVVQGTSKRVTGIELRSTITVSRDGNRLDGPIDIAEAENVGSAAEAAGMGAVGLIGIDCSSQSAAGRRKFNRLAAGFKRVDEVGDDDAELSCIRHLKGAAA